MRFWRAIASARVTCVECSKRDNKSSEACELVNCRENRRMSGHESQRLIVKLRAARVCLHRRFTEGLDTPVLQDAKALLDELASV